MWALIQWLITQCSFINGHVNKKSHCREFGKIKKPFCSFILLFSYCKINAHIISSAFPSVQKKQFFYLFPITPQEHAWIKISVSNNVVEKTCFWLLVTGSLTVIMSMVYTPWAAAACFWNYGNLDQLWHLVFYFLPASSIWHSVMPQDCNHRTCAACLK